MRTIENWELTPRALAHNWKIQGVRFFWNKFCICREQLFKFDANVGEMCKANSWNSPLNGPGSSVGSFRGGESRKEHKSQKNEGGYKYLQRLINWKGEKEEKEGKGRTGFCKSIFSSLWRRLLQRRAEKMSEALQHGFCVHLECTALETEHVAHCTLFIAHRTLHNAHCVGAAFEWPETGLLARLWDVVHLSRTLQPLYLSTRSTLLQPFCTEGCSGAQDAPCSPESWDEWVWIRPGLCVYVWSGLIKMDCCTKFVIQTAL